MDVVVPSWRRREVWVSGQLLAGSNRKTWGFNQQKCNISEGSFPKKLGSIRTYPNWDRSKLGLTRHELFCIHNWDLTHWDWGVNIRDFTIEWRDILRDLGENSGSNFSQEWRIQPKIEILLGKWWSNFLDKTIIYSGPSKDRPNKTIQNRWFNVLSCWGSQEPMGRITDH